MNNLEKKIDEIEKSVHDIRENHLAHIKVSITKLDERMKLMLWVLSIIGATVIVNLFK